MITRKNILAGILLFEIVCLPLSIPAGAQIVDRVMFSVAPRTAHVMMPQTPGNTRFIIASNAPFSILSEGAIGDMTVNVRVNGHINGNSFGHNAQHPGDALPCVTPISSGSTTIYTARRKTAANRGAVIDQAIMVEISYDPSLHPKFSVETSNTSAAKRAISAPACNAVAS
jgi:hypothetical protein